MHGEKRKEAEMERRRQGKKETGKEVKNRIGHGGEEGNKEAGKIFSKLEYTRVVIEKLESWKEGGERGGREAWK